MLRTCFFHENECCHLGGSARTLCGNGSNGKAPILILAVTEFEASYCGGLTARTYDGAHLQVKQSVIRSVHLTLDNRDNLIRLARSGLFSIELADYRQMSIWYTISLRLSCDRGMHDVSHVILVRTIYPSGFSRVLYMLVLSTVTN